MAETQRRPSDFMIMVALVVASLVIGGVLLVVVPRAAPATAPEQPVAAPSALPVPSAWPTEASNSTCFRDREAQARLLPPQGRLAIVPPVSASDITRMAIWWDVSEPVGMQTELRRSGLAGCATLTWIPDTCCSVEVAVLRFNTADGAAAVAAYAADYLRPFDHEPGSSGGSEWFETRRVGRDHEFTGVTHQGRYVAFLRLFPIRPTDTEDGFATLLKQQYELLGAE
jgi:hypothetical protein